MKKTVFLLIALVIGIFLYACAATPETPENDTPSDGQNNGGQNSGGQDGDEASVSLSEIRNSVADAYGTGYRADTKMDASYFADTYGTDASYIEDIYGEYPSSADYNDTFIALKAAEGRGQDVETALNSYRTGYLSDETLSGHNKYRAGASQVYRNGDYVFYMQLGRDYDGTSEDENEITKYWNDQSAIGLDAVKGYFD